MSDVLDTKLSLESQNPLGERLKALRDLIPEAFTEDRVDFDKLRGALGDVVETQAERYGLTWAGKSEAIRAVQIPSKGTLEPMPDQSVDFDESQNVIIEGDNLEVLKLLQKSYYGKIKMIYIDPPYNTGNEFIYPDNFREGLEDYLIYSGQRSDDGMRQTSSEERAGRKHSKWLNMMYPRLFLARNLLKEDGVIFISIDDNEVQSLRGLMDEIFGEENFIAQVVWEGANKNDAKQIGIVHEYVVVYARQRFTLPNEWGLKKEGVKQVLSEVERLKTKHGTDYAAASRDLAGWFRAMKATPSFGLRRFRNIDSRGTYKEDDPTAPGGRRFELRDPRNGSVIPLRKNRGWSFSQSEFERLVSENRISFVTDQSIMVRRYLHETDKVTPPSVFYQPARSASERLIRLMGESVFDFPKDESILSKFVEMATDSDEEAIVLDFFAGSGTTGQAVTELNEDDGGNRRFILVQLPEPTDRPDYPTITDITRERVRRVIAKLDKADEGKLELAPRPGRGFKAFRLAASNFRVWDGDAARDAAALEQQLELFAANVTGDAEPSVLFELVLKAGYPLTAQIERLELGGPVYAVQGKALYLCLANPVTQKILSAVTEAKPERFICLDIAFQGKDELKTNTVLQLRSAGIAFQTA